jgi:hypothetical protein
MHRMMTNRRRTLQVKYTTGGRRTNVIMLDRYKRIEIHAERVGREWGAPTTRSANKGVVHVEGAALDRHSDVQQEPRA